jgi:DNA-binding winged helix-turn-helix (wHTH) protein
MTSAQQKTIRGLTAVLALTILAVGTPVGLLAVGADPRDFLPHEWPRLSEIQNWPNQLWQAARFGYYDGSLIRSVVLGTVWSAWLVLMWMIVSETIRQVRHGIHLPSRLSLGDPRSWVVGLVAAVLILLSSAQAGAATAATPLAVPTQYDGSRPPAPTRSPSRAWVAPSVHPECPRITVVHGQTLWSIAEAHLGDGNRYRDIDRLNADRIPHSDHLLPGDLLLLPADAHDLPPAGDPHHGGEHTVLVQPGDTASGIAKRELGNAEKWTEIWERNRYQPQPDGRVWLHPDRLLPGWTLWVTSPVQAPPPPEPQPQKPVLPPPPSPPPSITTTPPQQVDQPPPPAPDANGSPALWVAASLAAAVATAAVTVRRRQRRAYRPGSEHRDDLAVAPVVYQLRAPADHRRVVPGHKLVQDVGVATRDSKEIALNIASVHGLGIIGPGAPEAARALLIALLTHRDEAVVIVPAADLEVLFPKSTQPDQWPARLRVAADLAAAVAEAEDLSEIMDDTSVALVARPHDPDVLQRLVGEHTNVSVVLLGTWPAGLTATVDAHGTISATNPEDDRFTAAQIFQLPAHEAADLLALLHDAEPKEAAAPPAPPNQDQLEITTARPASVSASDFELPEPRSSQPETLADPVIKLSVLGPPRLGWRSAENSTREDITSAFSPRQLELLVFLAIHPDGVHRDTLLATLWANNMKATNAMNTAFSRLRHTVTVATANAVTSLTTTDNGRYQLDPAVVDVDFWHFSNAIARRRTATSEPNRVAEYQQTVKLYAGQLAEGVDSEWIEAARESIRRDALDAVTALARSSIDVSPEVTLDLLETARSFDPYNELVYRDIMRLQRRLGRLEAIPRTLGLLTTRLAEIDEKPNAETRILAEALQHQLQEGAKRIP